MATREEELQKKREEAERKARRGEIDPTHDFTIQVSFIYCSGLKRWKTVGGGEEKVDAGRLFAFRSWPS